MQIARVSLSSLNYQRLDKLANKIKEIAEKHGAGVRGPLPLPTKRMRVTTRKSPCADGTETYERWEMRVHKRVVDISVNERALRRIMRIQIPEGVHIEIELKN